MKEKRGMANPRSYLHCIKNEDVNHLVLLLDGQSDLSLTQHPLGFPLKRLRMPQLLVKVINHIPPLNCSPFSYLV